MLLYMEPDIEVLTKELKVLTTWLSFLVHHDGDLDLEFDGVDLAFPNDIIVPMTPKESRQEAVLMDTSIST